MQARGLHTIAWQRGGHGGLPIATRGGRYRFRFDYLFFCNDLGDSLMVNILRKALFVAALAALVAGGVFTANAAIIDDFSDLDDTNNPTWTHLSGTVNSTGQSWDASGANYRLQAPNNGLATFGFVGSHVGPVYTDVNVMSTVVNFVAPVGNVFGVAAHLNGVNTLGGLSGYAYVYEPFADSLRGEMVLYKVNPSLANLTQDIGSQKVTLDPNKDYMFVLDINHDPNGDLDNSDQVLHAWVTEVGGAKVAEITRTDGTYGSGFSGLIGFSQGSAGLPPSDTTWDDFKTQIPEPASSILVAMCVGVLLLARRQRPIR